MSWPKRTNDGAGDGFVTSIRGLFNSQRRKAKAFVLRTMRGEAENEIHGEWSESEAEFSPFARQLTITKAKRLIKRHTKKFRSRGQKSQCIHPSFICHICHCDRLLFFLFRAGRGGCHGLVYLLSNLTVTVLTIFPTSDLSQQKESLPASPRESTPFESDSSSGSSPYEDFHE